MSLVMFASCGLNPCSNGIQKYTNAVKKVDVIVS